METRNRGQHHKGSEHQELQKVDDNTENHSRQRISFSLENPTKSRPKLVTSLDLSETKQIFEVRAEEMKV